MKAIITMTIHDIQNLDSVQLGNMSSLLIATFAVVPVVVGDTMSVTFQTDEPAEAVLDIEAMMVSFARRFSPLLWTSIALSWHHTP